jgi:hypothetical protein
VSTSADCAPLKSSSACCWLGSSDHGDEFGDTGEEPNRPLESREVICSEDRRDDRSRGRPHDPIRATKIDALLVEFEQVRDLPRDEEDPASTERQPEMETISVTCREVDGAGETVD